ATKPAAPTLLGYVYPKKFYGANIMGVAAMNFLDSCADTDPFFLYFALDSCHQGQTDALERELKYDGTVSPTWFMLRDGVPGKYASTISSTDKLFGKGKIQWSQRQDDLKTVNDNLQMLFDYAANRGWADNITWIITSDQGVHHGEHGLW